MRVDRVCTCAYPAPVPDGPVELALVSFFLLQGILNLGFYFWSLVRLPDLALSEWERKDLRANRWERKGSRKWLIRLYEILSIPLFGLIVLISFGAPILLSEERSAWPLGWLPALGFANLFFLLNVYNAALEILAGFHSGYGLIIRRFHSQGYFHSAVARKLGWLRLALSTLIWMVTVLLNLVVFRLATMGG